MRSFKRSFDLNPLSLLTLLLIPALLVVFGQPAWAADLLRKSPGSWLYGPRAVWTDGTTTAIFHPLSEPMQTSALSKVRIAYQLSELGGPCRIRPAVRFSDDGGSWDAGAAVDSTNYAYVTSNTVSYPPQFVDIYSIPGTTPKSWIQFGVQAANGAAGAPGSCNATIRIEPVVQ